MRTQQANELMQTSFDVVIMGGGLAGLTLARQLRMQREQTTILVVEKNQHPVPEAAHKVGESTVEAGTYYLREVIGLKELLEESHLIKVGLRFFLSYEDNADIERRFEFGSLHAPPVPSHQLDRGRLENQLASLNQQMGICFLDNASITDIELGDPRHTVVVQRAGASQSIEARWLIDATGLTTLLKRKLKLGKPSDHSCNAVWFRMDAVINAHHWSDDKAFRVKVPEDSRRLSTTHLMGNGYWVWLIPLSSGGTSVGIVADSNAHPISRLVLPDE